MDPCASGKTQGFKSAKIVLILQIQQNVKIDYYGIKVIGPKSLASHFLSPPLIVGNIQFSKSQLSSSSSTALTSQLLIFRGGPLARVQRTTY